MALRWLCLTWHWLGICTTIEYNGAIIKVLASFYLVLAMSFGASAQTRSDTDKAVEKWQKCLTKAFEKDSRGVMIDVDLSRPPLELKKALANPFSEKMAAAIMDRVYRESAGYITFGRSNDHVLSGESLASRTILDELLSLGPDVLQDLTKGRPLSELSPATQIAFARIAYSLQPGMADSLIGGEDYQVSLQAAPIAQYVNPNSRLRYSLPLPAKAPPRPQGEKKSVSRPEDGFPAAVKGDLDFGTGELLPLSRVLEKATQTFKVGFDYDGRLSGTALFIKGQWTKESLTEALATLYKIDPPKVPADRPTVREGLRRVLEGPLAGLLDSELWANGDGQPSARDLLKGQDLTYDDLLKKSPALAQLLGPSALSNGTVVSLRLGLQLNITGSGVIPLANAAAKSETQSFTVSTKNEAGFVIVP